MWVIRYDLSAIDFRPWARAALDGEDLGGLHECADPRPFASYVERLQFHTARLNDRFVETEALYRRLVEEVIAPLFNGVRRYQSLSPSFRCHLAGAGTASAFHRDGEAKYRVSRDAINAWVPLTPAWDTNSLHVETAVGSRDHRPVALKPGEILLFDGYHREHGSVENKSGRTRISFDLRFVPADKGIAAEMGLYPPGHVFAGDENAAAC